MKNVAMDLACLRNTDRKRDKQKFFGRAIQSSGDIMDKELALPVNPTDKTLFLQKDLTGWSSCSV